MPVISYIHALSHIHVDLQNMNKPKSQIRVGIPVYQKITILSSCTHPHVVPNLYDFFLVWNTKEDILMFKLFLSIQLKSRGSKNIGPHWLNLPQVTQVWKRHGYK